MSLSSAPNVSPIFSADLVISDSLLLESTLYALDTYSRGNCHPPECCHKWCRNLHYHWWHLAPHTLLLSTSRLLFFPKAAGLGGRTETGRHAAAAQPVRAFCSSQHPWVTSAAQAGWVSACSLSERRRQDNRWCWLSTCLLGSFWSDSAPGTETFLVLSCSVITCLTVLSNCSASIIYDGSFFCNGDQINC